MSKESDFEDAVIAHLQTQVTTLKSVQAYAGESPEEWIKKTVLAFPAAMVHIGRETVGEESEDYEYINADAQLFVYIGSRNPRSTDESRTGAYEVMESIREKMHNQFIGGTRLRWKEQDAALIMTNLCLYYQKYDFKFNIL